MMPSKLGVLLKIPIIPHLPFINILLFSFFILLYDNSFLPEYMNERGDISVIPDVEKYKIVEENEYMFYVYDFLIGQHILTIDTARNRTRLDRLNIYGQCYSFGDKWEKVTKTIINRALRRDGYVFDDYIKEHFTEREKR